MRKNTLWLTYAWKDNEDEGVDFVIQKLTTAGLDVQYDRRQLIPGQRLWPQIEACITNPDLDAWAIYVTENSLRSEPCREELQYALVEAISVRSPGFPIIGIVPGPIDAALIPMAIRTRPYVNLREDDWIGRVVSGVRRELPPEPISQPDEFGCEFRQVNATHVLEVWPRLGVWGTPRVVIAMDDRDNFILAGIGSRRQVLGSGMYSSGHSGVRGETWFTHVSGAASADSSLHILFRSVPKYVEFGGSVNGGYKMFRVDFGIM